MKFKHLFQTLTLITLLFSFSSASQLVQAKPLVDAQVISRDFTYWNGTYSGTVNEARYEQWAFTLTEEQTFIVTALATWGDLVPLVSLLDVNENLLASATGTLTSTQPAGDYFVLIQPQSGSGNYDLTIREVESPINGTSVTVGIAPSSIEVGETALVTASLNDVPAGGIASAEFTCTYDMSLIEVSAITEVGLFGTDAAMVVSGPANGMFILAIAGSNGQKATTSGGVLTFNALGLQVGETSILCTTRASTGDNTLVEVPSTPATLSIIIPNGTLTGTVLAIKPVTISLYDATSILFASTTVDENGSFSLTAPAGAYTVVATAEGCLSAQGSPVITSGNVTTMSTITLPVGDIDGNTVIDQYDALTIGMNYNTYLPTAADLNNDGTINVLDLELLAYYYRQSGALAWQ